MERITVQKTGFLPTLMLSLFLLMATGTVNKADATPAPNQTINGAQLAWWHGGGYGWGGGYYRPGWRGYNACRCWINRWGYRRCNC